ncbi:putative pseudopilin I precursor [Gluconacetobacter diazotrophicus PA1 5]|uniref:Pseudopilin I n=2 Tax=Gluconacetobacter diazotrophicus TaxID=33996 RepID=Q79E15_GLUDI|nr:prepilin-type N-terminal cleavage/methylation domain-containing protein [Gluconacetobacter diazotrophicus]AAM92871.1 pseudopilin I precursor [Gluconacetobacter diazotrophicus]ACI51302.1 putative pseudopilin I precursor [Gluconacetobacter diazotrophicus PA1 5]MBB2154995.1 pseudopilin I [Gluconacetobacter diazotrophicus]TWB09850.1 general secretion pathway protein I [Gluconacetobacter diazotrophicus]CAP54427.1 putative pseudopilin I precursor [Gluconacetobacter diazotrophicus PA1 5]
MSPRHARERGFTLIEVLVAFVIVMLALGVVYEGIAGGIEATRITNRTEEALSRAQSHLAAVGHGMRIAPGTQAGDDGSLFHWQVHIVPEQSGHRGQGVIVLYRVEVSESWPDIAAQGGRRTVVLRTQRLGGAAE